MRSQSLTPLVSLFALAASTVACATSEEAADTENAAFVDTKADEWSTTQPDRDARAVLRVANGASHATLREAVGLYGPATTHLTGYRAGADGVRGTADDRVIDTLAELDAIPYIGPVSYRQLIDYSTTLAWQDWVPATATVSVPMTVTYKTWSSLSQSDPHPDVAGTAKPVNLALTLETDGTSVRVADLERTRTIALTGDGTFDLSFHESGVSFDQRNIFDRRRTLTGRIDARGEVVITQYSEVYSYGNSIYGYNGNTTTLNAEAYAGLAFIDP